MTECYCDFEPSPDFYRQARQKAAKTHRCSECTRAITPGEQYEVTVGKWEGEVCTFKTCIRCLALRDWVTAHVPCVCWLHENMIEDCVAAADDYAYEAPGLMFGTLRRVVAIRRVSRPEPRP